MVNGYIGCIGVELMGKKLNPNGFWFSAALAVLV
jgi:hypothetical protein